MNKKQQLFLLHFAGGNSYSFQFLKPYLEHKLEFIPIELPGRGKRMGKELLKDKNKAIQDYFNQIKSKRNGQPYAIYGHSMGADLGLDLTSKLEGIGDPPIALVVSGNAGPGIGVQKNRHLMENDEFKDELRLLGGVPDELLSNEELFELFRPILKADFELLEKEFYTPINFKLSTPIYAMMGSEEEDVTFIDNWKEYTLGNYNRDVFQGNHFFIYKYPNRISEIIIKCYDKV